MSLWKTDKPGLKFYLGQILIGFDQLLNTFFMGWADETISSRSYRWEKNGVRRWPRILIDKLFFFEKNHCYGSYLSEVYRRQAPPETRNNDELVNKTQSALNNSEY